MKAHYKKHILEFKSPSGTSRGVLRTKETWYIIIDDNGKMGVGECGILRGLSYDDVPDYEQKLEWACSNITKGPQALWEQLIAYPSIQAGIEMAFLSLKSNHPYVLFPSTFTEGTSAIEINGLIWMGDEDFMRAQVAEKLEQGFDCIKMKIGAIDFKDEMAILSSIRKSYNNEQLTLRVDANGGFAFAKAKEVLFQLAELDIHSIEQPIATKQWEAMASLCASTPTPIALDEELIGVTDLPSKRKLLETIKPQYIILKPSFIGGFKGSQEWIDVADSLGIAWWITSALESNIGLNAIAQWTHELGAKGPQGLGTGSLFTNNISSPLEVVNGTLRTDNNKHWNFKL
ncbi:o-succinylbenzoate synthase [Dokdonia sp. Hel_I_63]|uniref:o-succinylbenzoate synthase n=1 Tax=unclassified Dokdonia TaxID=2615033 RepID=UPI00020A7C04|nr:MULTISPECIES: o-succinylbenzoate synthase [unclassified Dokdonia]AEE18282.1 Mandelate racemase/muconate lactonizing protein [Dokdonia sp. 4H-3-7-5]TVZ22485.1 o-succinylbenzoate synthase [Dokdonia sp. Hel_I_63]